MKTYDLPARLAAEALREADRDIRAKHYAGVFDNGDPNHPKYNGGINHTTGMPDRLFGYDAKAFMAKQHRVLSRDHDDLNWPTTPLD